MSTSESPEVPKEEKKVYKNLEEVNEAVKNIFLITDSNFTKRNSHERHNHQIQVAFIPKK